MREELAHVLDAHFVLPHILLGRDTFRLLYLRATTNVEEFTMGRHLLGKNVFCFDLDRLTLWSSLSHENLLALGDYR